MDYDSSLEQVKKTLVSMKRSIDDYKLKDDANPKFVEARESILASITNYVLLSEQIIVDLTKSNAEEKIEGFRKGLKTANNRWHNLQTFGKEEQPFLLNKEQAEQLRATTKLNAINKWPELY
jgi:hypothetical protein